MNRLIAVTKVALLAAVLSNACLATKAHARQLLAPPPKSLLGQPLAQAQQLEFFKFFHFSLADSRPDPNHAGVSLKMFSVGGNFKGKVFLLIATRNSDDTIQSAALVLRRDFIDTPGTARFARDVAKSFLEISPGSQTAAAARLHREIWRGCDPGTKQYDANHQGALTTHACEKASERSTAYRVFLGKSKHDVIPSPTGLIDLQNMKGSVGESLLFMTINPPAHIHGT